MCVICHKPKNVRFPDKELIDAMWCENPHGAGAMWYGDDGLVHWKKGFMTLKSFNRWVSKNRSWLEDVECALHFRITTHGGTSRGNCHPFVCDLNADPHLESGSAKCVMMHNGILPVTPRSDDISDSAELALRVGEYTNPLDALMLLDEFIETGNRILVFHMKEGSASFGDKFESMPNLPEYDKYKGLTFSNLHFEDLMNDRSTGRSDYFRFWRDHDGRVSRFDSRRESVVKIGDVLPSSVKITDTNGNDIMPIKWDNDKECFYNALNGSRIPIEDVDPDSLSGEDYDIYAVLIQRKANQFHTRDNQMETDCAEYDPDIVELAHYYGMTVQEYLGYEGECAKSDNGANTRVKEVA